jgi:hypothetical protein
MGDYGYIMVKLVGCGPVVSGGFLKISLAWNNPSKKALIYYYDTKKKIHPLFHLVHPKYPYIVLKYRKSRGLRTTGV